MSNKQPVEVVVTVDPQRLAEVGKATLAATEQHAFGMVLLIVFAVVVVAGLVAAGRLVWNWRRPVEPCAMPQVRPPEPPPAPARQRQPQGRQRKGAKRARA